MQEEGLHSIEIARIEIWYYMQYSKMPTTYFAIDIIVIILSTTLGFKYSRAEGLTLSFKLRQADAYETDYMIADCTPDVHGEAQLLPLGTMDNDTPG